MELSRRVGLSERDDEVEPVILFEDKRYSTEQRRWRGEWGQECGGCCERMVRCELA